MARPLCEALTTGEVRVLKEAVLRPSRKFGRHPGGALRLPKLLFINTDQNIPLPAEIHTAMALPPHTLPSTHSHALLATVKAALSHAFPPAPASTAVARCLESGPLSHIRICCNRGERAAGPVRGCGWEGGGDGAGGTRPKQLRPLPAPCSPSHLCWAPGRAPSASGSAQHGWAVRKGLSPSPLPPGCPGSLYPGRLAFCSSLVLPRPPYCADRHMSSCYQPADTPGQLHVGVTRAEAPLPLYLESCSKPAPRFVVLYLLEQALCLWGSSLTSLSLRGRGFHLWLGN
ncbi:PREDICTED: uncharacterized protein LOC104997555 [Bison bison bison]|uniref:Uncharacterized protein LOC104997555 n=1 Tax=Bison bison bison TaxID=43346 RepID=A0A6P3IFV1_BISBB|nr:PREDICTED: uncharacterized protein LOC104997555 [Bison bison bison]